MSKQSNDMEIGNKILQTVDLFGIKIAITQTLISTWVLMGAIFAFSIFVRISLRSFHQVPTGIQNAVESMVEFADSFVASIVGEKLIYLSPWFFTVMLFMFLSNISGIIGLRPPTSDWSTTIALSLCTFFLIHTTAIKHRKDSYIKGFLKPFFVFLPLNLINELSKPISLSFRLFGNMLSGLILMTIIYSIPIYLRFVLPVPLNVYFDIAIGALQTYIFTMLSLSFIRNAAMD